MKVFIGSSKESLALAESLAVIVEDMGYSPFVWNKAFTASRTTIESLEKIVKDVVAAIFVFAEDDKTWYRDDLYDSVRDNVIFEYGLFCGHLSRYNVCIYCKGTPKIASDLHGITYINSSSEYKAKNELAQWFENMPEKNNDIVNDENFVTLLNQYGSEFSKTLNEIKKNINLSHTKCEYCKFYISSYENRIDLHLQDIIAQTRKRIWIMTPNLNSHTYMIQQIEDALAKNVDVRVLALDPRSNFVKLRYKEVEHDNPKSFFEEMKTALKSFSLSYKKLKKLNNNYKYEIKTYNHFPSSNIFIIDNKLIFNPILPSGKARTTIHFMFDISYLEARKMTEKLNKTFVDCWKNSEPVVDDYIYPE